MRRALLGREDPEVAVTLAELGRVYQDEGLNAKAEPLHREALRIRRTVLGAEHRETAVSLSDLASVLRLNGDLSGAEALLNQCLEANLKTRGADHPNTATTRHDLALIAMSRGDHGRAESMLREVLPMQRKALGAALVALARYPEAEAVLLDARQELEASPVGRPHELRATLSRLVELYAAWGKPEMAATYRALLAAERT